MKKRGDKDKGGGEMWEAGDKSRHPNKYTVIDNHFVQYFNHLTNVFSYSFLMSSTVKLNGVQTKGQETEHNNMYATKKNMKFNFLVKYR